MKRCLRKSPPSPAAVFVPRLPPSSIPAAARSTQPGNSGPCCLVWPLRSISRKLLCANGAGWREDFERISESESLGHDKGRIGSLILALARPREYLLCLLGRESGRRQA